MVCYYLDFLQLKNFREIAGPSYTTRKPEAYLTDYLTHNFFGKISQNDSEGGVAKNQARFGLSRVNHPHVDYLLVKIYSFEIFLSCSLCRGVTPMIS